MTTVCLSVSLSALSVCLSHFLSLSLSLSLSLHVYVSCIRGGTVYSGIIGTSSCSNNTTITVAALILTFHDLLSVLLQTESRALCVPVPLKPHRNGFVVPFIWTTRHMNRCGRGVRQCIKRLECKKCNLGMECVATHSTAVHHAQTCSPVRKSRPHVRETKGDSQRVSSDIRTNSLPSKFGGNSVAGMW